jgi:methionyl aminopeptidase
MKPKTDQEIRDMRTSGRILAEVLSVLKRDIKAGMTTAELAGIAARELEERGGKPVFKGYVAGPGMPPFPDVICISVSEEVDHAIPGGRVLVQGDVVGMDFGVNYHGMITDSAITVSVGKASADVKRLLAGTEQALYVGIDQVRPGAHIGDISAAVQARLKRDHLGIVEELAGHGVGHELHEDPYIPNYGPAGKGPILREGMTIAIEPIANLGKGDIFWSYDGWTIKTLDGSLSAHFEHTVLVTRDGYEIMTQI